MTFIHYTTICHGFDTVHLPSEFTSYNGQKYIKIVGVSTLFHTVNGICIPYIISSQKLARYLKQNFISTNLQNPLDNELNFITLSTTILNGYSVLIPWDYEKTFDIELIDCYQGLRYSYDYIIELELCME